ncbi:MAG TPA: class I SAM-dependent methyltransferase [Flavobacterium sp.]|nr:class I SAM-dependent methyltransferase [Flavobacterium sp.]
MGNLSEQELKELASQLSCPKGEGGIAVAESMNAANGNMISKAMSRIGLHDNHEILEIGPGSGSHVWQLFQKNATVKYTGIDISELMVEQASKLCSGYAFCESAVFELADGKTIDKPDSFFDAVFTVNTLYFWNSPQHYLLEIARVLKSAGQFVLAFIPKHVMVNLPFTRYGFKLYDNESILNLLEGAGFKINEVISETEEVLSSTGDKKVRSFTIVRARKL